MAVIAAFLQKLKYFLSKSIVPTENGFVNLISSIYSPHLHILTVILAATLIYFVFKQARSQKTNEKHSATLKAITPQDLSWLNKILTWTFVTASQGMPPVVETWIQDINIALAKQKNSFKVLVYGLREGSAPPWLKEITEVKRTNNELNGKVLLETSEMGLLITVQETLGSKEISSSYSAIFVHFQCWFTARLVRYHGNAVLQLQPAEKNPIFRIKMKPLTKQTLVSTVPESVAEAVKSAFLNSMFFIDASTWEPLSPNLDGGHEEEESCYADSEDDITFKDVNELPSTPRMAPRGMVNGLTKLNLNKKARPVM
uniref:Uncharacterized protein n=1 Tax=Ciona savignyi TaxID=51511 RepID=H2Z1R1_CIOSA